MIKLLTSFLSGDKAIPLHLYEGILAWLLSWEVNAHVVHWFVPPVALEENGSTQPNVAEGGKFPSQWPLCLLRSGCLGEKKGLNSCVPWRKKQEQNLTAEKGLFGSAPHSWRYQAVFHCHGAACVQYWSRAFQKNEAEPKINKHLGQN